MVAGGAESCIHPLAVVGFERSRSLTVSHNETPLEASRPFDRGRDGFVIAEGGVAMVLEVRSFLRSWLLGIARAQMLA